MRNLIFKLKFDARIIVEFKHVTKIMFSFNYFVVLLLAVRRTAKRLERNEM